MKAIIPLAGEGRRVRPHTFYHPKPLLKVADKPIISHIVDKVISHGVNDIAFIIGYRGDEIKEFIEKAYPDMKKTFFYQNIINGIASAVILAEKYLTEEDVFIILGDTLFEADLESVFEGEFSSIGVNVVEDPRRFGTADIDDEGFITKLVEKPKNPTTNLTLTGLYYIKEGRVLKEAIEELFKQDKKTNGEYQITDALHIMVEMGEKTKTFNLTKWFDCGKFDAVLETNRSLLDKMDNNSKYNTSLVDSQTYIESEVELKNTIIGPFTSISTGTKITDSIVKNSIIGCNAVLEGVNITDSIIGDNVEIQGEKKSYNIGAYSSILML